MKRFYIAVTIKQDRNERTFFERTNPNYDPGYCAFVVSCTDQDNLKSVLDRIGGLQYANIFPTKKAAEEVARDWNEGYKANGTYFFDSPAKSNI